MSSKREKWIYWLIGVGCGIILTGLLMIYGSLSILSAPKTNISKAHEQEQQIETALEENSEDVLIGDNSSLEKTSEEVVNEDLPSPPIQVILPYGATATEICQILQDEGIVDSAVALRAYIAEQKKTTKLLTGDLTFPRGANFEEILDILVVKK